MPQAESDRAGAVPGRARAGGKGARKVRAGRPPAPSIDLIVGSPLWKGERGSKATVRRAIQAASAMAKVSGELAVLLADDSAVRALNRDWRNKDAATNVLAFPAGGTAPHATLRPLGDIVIAFETMAREAQTAQVPFAHHLAHLAVHGFLHLIGYDHGAEAEAETMEALEIAILRRLDVPNPYAAPGAEPDC
jgi:probable rRNA maturation factor